MQIFKADKKVGWFRPIYYFVPPAFAFVSLMLCADYLANNANEAPDWLFVAGGLTIFIQLVTAIREYRTWLLNWELKQAYTSMAKALSEELDDQTRNPIPCAICKWPEATKEVPFCETCRPHLELAYNAEQAPA